MCGFAGFFDTTGNSDEGILHAMNKAIVHRGPDDAGHEWVALNHGKLGMGFRRLSILDLSPEGHQPMYSPDHNQLITFNGEVYNFREIRSILEQDGIIFRSTGDTEVILHAYRKWGIECIQKFNGMFSFVLVDFAKRKIFLVRDRAGVKPLFWMLENGVLIWASELKCFHFHPGFRNRIDSASLSQYFEVGYISAPDSIFEGVKKVIPGHFLEIDMEEMVSRDNTYWDVYDHYRKPVSEMPFTEATHQLEKLLLSACQYRMIADVPVGVFLSGGYDSSAVAAILQSHSTQKLKTFSIGFEEHGFNEAPFAAKVAAHLGTDHEELYCTMREAMELVPKLPEVYDEPMGDSSAIPTMLVSRMARRKVTVALSADGGDELFAGYPKYSRTLKYLRFKNLLPVPVSAPLSYFLPSLAGDDKTGDILEKLKVIMRKSSPSDIFKVFISVFSPLQIKRLLKFQGTGHTNPFHEPVMELLHRDALACIQALDYKTYLVDDILQKVDRATMHFSLEGREPLMDYRLIEFVASLPSSYKLRDGVSKFMFREIVHRYIPRELMERPKMGFMVPVEDWGRKELRDLFRQYTEPGLVKKHGILNAGEVTRVMDVYFSGKKMNFQKIWFIMMFQMWHERWKG